MSIFDSTLEEKIRESIAYFAKLSSEGQVTVLTNPVNLTQPHQEKLDALLQSIIINMSLYDKQDITNGLVELGMDRTHATLLVDKMIEQAPTVSYQIKNVVQILGNDFGAKYPKIVSDHIIDGKDKQELVEHYKLKSVQINYIISAHMRLSNDRACGRSETNIRTMFSQSGISEANIY